jgi:hypothetical protein
MRCSVYLTISKKRRKPGGRIELLQKALRLAHLYHTSWLYLVLYFSRRHIPLPPMTGMIRFGVRDIFAYQTAARAILFLIKRLAAILDSAKWEPAPSAPHRNNCGSLRSRWK